MIIRKAKYHKCKSCGSTRSISPEAYGCDYCGTEINLANPDTDYLRLVVFYDGDTDKGFQFCSWVCVLNKLKTIHTYNFISLPYLHSDTNNEKLTGTGFWNAIKELGKGNEHGKDRKNKK